MLLLLKMQRDVRENVEYLQMFANRRSVLCLFSVPQWSGQGSRMAPGLELCCRWSLLWAGRRDREQVDESVRESLGSQRAVGCRASLGVLTLRCCCLTTDDTDRRRALALVNIFRRWGVLC
jgi:hypothetical protein